MCMSRTSKSKYIPALWQELCAVLWNRKNQAIGLFTIIIATGVGTMALMTPLYESSLKILVTPGAEAVNTPAQVLTNQNDLLSEIELLKSREVFAATLNELALSPDAAQEKAARLSVEVLNQSRVIQVTYRDSSAEQAARFLQTLFQKYSEHRQKLQPQASVETALRDRSAHFNQKLDETTNALKNLDTKHGLMSLQEQQDLLLKQLYETQTQAAAASTEKQALEQQITTLRSQLATQPEQVETSSVTKYAQALDKMKEELIALEMQRTQLQQKYQPNHRLIRDLEQRITQAKELITREEQNPPRERSFALNDMRRRITNDLFNAETTLAALSQREQRLKQLAQEYQGRLSELNLQGFKKGDLERERALNEEAYLLYQKKAQEAEISDVINQTNRAQVSLAEAASLNPRPVSPDWLRNLSGLFLLGLLTSTGGVIAAESLRPRIRTAAGIQHRLGLNVLAKLPAATNAKTDF